MKIDIQIDTLAIPTSAGEAGGQSFTGGTGAGDNLTLSSTANATKGSVVVSDSLRLPLVISSAASLTLSGSHHTVVMNDSGNQTVVLPAAAGITGRQYIIKKGSGGAFVVTIDPNAAETIDGLATIALYADGDFIAIESNGTNWIIVADRRKPHCCRMTRSTAQSIANASADEKVNLNAADIDDFGMANTGTGVITILRSGRYKVDAYWQPNAAVTFTSTTIKKGGAAVTNSVVGAGSAGFSGAGACDTMDLVAGDTLELYVGQVSGSAANTITTASQRPRLCVTEVR